MLPSSIMVLQAKASPVISGYGVSLGDLRGEELPRVVMFCPPPMVI